MNIFKKFSILISICLSIFALNSCQIDSNLSFEEQLEQYAPQVGQKAPVFKHYYDVYDNEYSLDDYLGSNVLLIFETTFCTYCAEERPFLETLQDKYSENLKILTVDIGEDLETVKEHIEKYQIANPWLIDRESWLATEYLAFGTPKHFFIDQQGYIQDIIQGYADLEALELGIEKLEDANDFY